MNPTKSTLSHSLTSTLKYDLKSGIAVFLVALPLCLGIALASGAPLFSGIIAGVVGGLVVGSLSGSQLSVSGPAAGLTVIVLSAIEKLGQFDVFLLAVVIAGILQVLMGIAKAGVVSHYFPSAVIKGMLAAIGITLILKQVPHALGYDADPEGEFSFWQVDGENTFSEIGVALGNISPGAIIITVLCMALIWLWERPFMKQNAVAKQIPSALVVVVVGVLLNVLYGALGLAGLVLGGNHLVALPVLGSLGELPSLFTFPDFSALNNPQVYVSAVTIAIVASLETLLNVEATDKLDPQKRHTPPNRELMAQGAGNLLSGLVGGIPVTSVIVRSSVNINTGARSKFSAIIHGVLLAVCVVAIPGLLNKIPLACLAAILLMTGYKLAKAGIFKQMYSLGWNQFLPFAATIAAVLFTDLLVGIGVGMVVGVFFILKANYKTSYFFHRVPSPETDHIKINLSEHVSFLNKASIIGILENLPENSTVEINGANSAYIDYDVVEVIENFRETAKARNIDLRFISQETKLLDQAIEQLGHKDRHGKDAYARLFEKNREWVAQKLSLDPDYFTNLAKGQQPTFLFISCSDSRIPANEITGTSPGEVFVHRNIANLVVNTDLNMLSVLQYAVEVLKVQHVIVCGHYGCGGVKAAMTRQNLGLINTWLRNIKDVYRLHRVELNAIKNEDDRFKRLVELNVMEQVYNLHKTAIVQNAWQSGAELHVHGWVYDLREGLINDLEIDVERHFAEYSEIYQYDTAPERQATAAKAKQFGNR